MPRKSWKIHLDKNYVIEPSYFSLLFFTLLYPQLFNLNMSTDVPNV